MTVASCEGMRECTPHLAALLDATAPDRDRRASQLLEHFGGERLLLASRNSLLASALVTPAEAERIFACAKLARGLLARNVPAGLDGPSAAAQYLAWRCLDDVESLWTLAVDPGLRPLLVTRVARGAPYAVSAIAGEVFRPALVSGAHGLFVAHNHPSGDPTPSDADEAFTRRLKRQARLLDLVLHDHLVISGCRWRSCLYDDSGEFGGVARAVEATTRS